MNAPVTHTFPIQPSTTTFGVPTIFANKAYPVRNGIEVRYYVNGEDLFEKLADDLKKARKSIRYIAWGFNPLMVMVRRKEREFDRRNVLKEILEERAREGVKIKILVWHPDASLATLSPADATAPETGPDPESLDNWVTSLNRSKNENIEIKAVDGSDVSDLSKLPQYPSQHQKNVIIDMEDPPHTVAYVMGHNSVPYYWDTSHHLANDPRRNYTITEKDGQYTAEQGTPNGPLSGGLHDYSARLRGPIVRDIYDNFRRMWNYTEGSSGSMWSNKDLLNTKKQTKETTHKTVRPDSEYVLKKEQPAERFDEFFGVLLIQDDIVPAAQVQYVTTNVVVGPKSGVGALKSIRQSYKEIITKAQKYVYINNQYIRDHVLFKEIFDEIKQNRGDDALEKIAFFLVGNDFDDDNTNLSPGSGNNNKSVDSTANTEYDTHQLFINYKINFVRCVLKTKDASHAQIYTHAKLLIVDDVYATSGSANANMRSLSHDSEANINVYDSKIVRNLRRRSWNVLVEDDMDDVFDEPMVVLKKWKDMANKNKEALGLSFTPGERRTGLGTTVPTPEKGTWNHNGTKFEKGIIVEFEPQKQTRKAPAGVNAAFNETSEGNSTG